MIDEVNAKLQSLLEELANGDDKDSQKVAEHVKKILALYDAGEIDDITRNELLSDAKEIIAVEKSAATLEAKIKLDEISNMLVMIISNVI